MMTQQLGKDVELREIGSPVAAGSSIDDNSDRIDMAGYEGAIFFTMITDSVDTGVAALTIEQNTSDADSGMAALSGAVDTATSAANDDLNQKFLEVSVHRPRERYLQAVRTSTTANIAYGSVWVMLYGKKKLPVSAHSTAAGTPAHVVSPAES